MRISDWSSDVCSSDLALLAWPIAIGGSESMLVVWLAAMALTAVVALAIGAISLRISGVYFIMITLAFAQMFYFFAVSLSAYGGADGTHIYLPGGLSLIDTGELGRTHVCTPVTYAHLV